MNTGVMSLKDIPDLKTNLLKEKLTIPMEPELKAAIVSLKQVHGKDHLEWLRRLIRREIEKLKSE